MELPFEFHAPIVRVAAKNDTERYSIVFACASSVASGHIICDANTLHCAPLTHCIIFLALCRWVPQATVMGLGPPWWPLGQQTHLPEIHPYAPSSSSRGCARACTIRDGDGTSMGGCPTTSTRALCQPMNGGRVHGAAPPSALMAAGRAGRMRMT